MVGWGAVRVEGEEGWERDLVVGEMKRLTREVLPTPWEPRTTILASRVMGRVGAGAGEEWGFELARVLAIMRGRRLRWGEVYVYLW